MGRAAALAVLVTLLFLPATSVASGAPDGQARESTRASADLLTVGAGYVDQAGSQRVRELQVRLRALGHDPGPIDGLFGPLTEAAVQAFQQAHGLAVDGVVGPRTQAAMRATGTGEQVRFQPVREVQRQLRALGYATGPIDGVYGPLTQAAVERFQRAQGLPATGVLGAHTAERLEARHATLAPERVARAGRPTPAQPDRSALADPPAQGVPPVPSLVGASPAADSSFSILRPAYLALIAALALVLLLTGIRAARRRERTPAPAAEPTAKMARAETRVNPGLASAALLGALVIGAAGGALFATRASPDESAATTAGSLVSEAAKLSTPSASRSERRDPDRAEQGRVARERRAARAVPAAPAPGPRATSSTAPREEPVLGAATTAGAAQVEPTESTPAQRRALAADITGTPSDGSPLSESDDLLAPDDSEARAARRLR